MKTVIFDLDGTLADTSGDLIAAANACFVDLGHDPLLDEDADRLTAFHGGRAMLRLGFSRLGAVTEADIDREYPRLLAFYEENIDTKTVLLLVGDTITDLKTARAANAPVILVGFGPEGGGVARLKPDAILPSYDQLGSVVSNLL